jgi:2-dehydro-3-deoxyphosphogluconate aldolase/(4S)-4-hydroxy-2-oxoglutarate aldolase
MPDATPLERIHRAGVLPVIAIPSVDVAVPLLEALAAGGLDCAEITLRTAAGVDAIRRARKALPGVLVGAGTVLTAAQAEEAIDAGAQFVVTPGFMPRVTAVCLERNVPIFPGVMTPTEIGMALDAGLTNLKFFPSETAGGIATLRALSGPFPQVRFMPSGGISPENLVSYLREPTVVSVGGSWMVTKQLVEATDLAAVQALAARAAEIVREVRRGAGGTQ